MSLADILTTYKDDKEVVQIAPLQFIEKDADGISLKGVLQRGRLKLGRAKSPRPQGISFRPSGITYGFCERLKIGQLAGLVTIYDKPPAPRLQLVFDVGHAYHNIIQDYFWQIGILKGTYRCSKCEKSYDDLVSPTECPSGKVSHNRALKYREVQLKAPDYLISGRCDGILVIEDEEHIMDIKTIANRTMTTSERQVCFEDLDQPKADHVVQLNLYMWMAKIYKGHLFYVAKNDHKIKSFAVPFQRTVIEPHLFRIREMIIKADQLKDGTLKELPTPCGDDKCLCHTILINSTN